jgi:hypothetical protein
MTPEEIMDKYPSLPYQAVMWLRKQYFPEERTGGWFGSILDIHKRNIRKLLAEWYRFQRLRKMVKKAIRKVEKEDGTCEENECRGCWVCELKEEIE